MKRIYFFTLALVFFACLNQGFAKDLLYLKIGITENFMVNSYEGQKDPSLGFTGGIVSDLGFQHDFDDKSSLLLAYEINYDGPGLKGASKQSFNARGLDHFFLAKYTEHIDNDLSYYVKADFFFEFYRIAKNESWTDGLYNFGKTGAGVGIDWNTSPDNKINLEVGLHYFWFPNYTDLSREAVYLLGNSSQLSEDSVNQNFVQLMLKADDLYKLNHDLYFNFQAYFIYRYYPKLTVDKGTLTPSTEKQKDFTIEGQAGLTYYFAHKLFSLDFIYRASYFHSNYGYLYLDVNNLSNSLLFANFSSYIEQRVSTPFSFYASEKSTLSLIPGFEYKYYFDRPAKDAGSNYLPGKNQYQVALTGGLSWSYKKHENLLIVPQYQIKWAKSNNKDQMMGFNYLAHYLGIQMIFEF